MGKDQQVFKQALSEFEKSMEYAGDIAYVRYNLGNLYVALDRPEEAYAS